MTKSTTKIVLIGAGSAQFGYGTLGDIFQSDVLAGAHIALHDINPTTMGQVADTANAFIDEHDLSFTISATTNRAEALQDADFVIISIEIADRFELWELDWRIPQQFGIQQVLNILDSLYHTIGNRVDQEQKLYSYLLLD